MCVYEWGQSFHSKQITQIGGALYTLEGLAEPGAGRIPSDPKPPGVSDIVVSCNCKAVRSLETPSQCLCLVLVWKRHLHVIGCLLFYFLIDRQR